MAQAHQSNLPDYEYPAETKEKLNWVDLEALDISQLDHDGGIEALASQLLGFISTNGFFYVKGHGLSNEQVKRQYAIGKKFFELPLEEKNKYLCNTANGDFRGYKARETGELAARCNDERYNIPKFTPEHARPHPDLILEHFDEIKEFSLHIHNHILLPLLRIFAHVLEVDPEYFVARHRYEAPGLEYLRYMLYHPRTVEDDARVGNIWAIGHTDYNTLTFLFHQPVAGLQVKTPSGWAYVRSHEGSIIVNVADALEFLSGGFLKSTVHRVVRPPEDQTHAPRLGLIYFARPEAAIPLKPVDSPLLARLGLQKPLQEGLANVSAEEWARARIAKDHRFRTGVVNTQEKEIIAGISQKYYD